MVGALATYARVSDPSAAMIPVAALLVLALAVARIRWADAAPRAGVRVSRERVLAPRRGASGCSSEGRRGAEGLRRRGHRRASEAPVPPRVEAHSPHRRLPLEPRRRPEGQHAPPAFLADQPLLKPFLPPIATTRYRLTHFLSYKFPRWYSYALYDLPGRPVLVALVQAKVLRRLLVRLGALDQDRVERRGQRLIVAHVRPADRCGGARSSSAGRARRGWALSSPTADPARARSSGVASLRAGVRSPGPTLR